MGRVPRPLRRPQDRARHLRTRVRHQLPARTRLRPLPDDAPRPRPTIPARRDHRKPERTPRRSPRTRLARRRPRTHHQHRRSRAEAHPDAPHRNQPRPPANAASDHHAHLNAMNTHRRALHPAWCRKEVGHVLLHGPGEFPATAPGPVSIPRTAATAGTSTIPTATTNPAVTTADCRGVREVEAESVAFLVTAAHGLPAEDYTFPYVTGWASEVDRAEPERVVRETGTRVLAASRTVLALTQPEHLGDGAGAELTAAAQLGTERSSAARDRAGATLALAQAPAADPTPDADVEALARLHADAAAFYAAQLAGDGPDATRAAALLTTRAVPAAAVAGYQLGYAPPGWTALTDHLRAHGYTDTQLLDAGVGLRTRRGTVVDRFRDRLMFPVRDGGGQRIVGFLGRALTEADDIPKYLNSPATALYAKGEVLYGLGAEPSRQALAAGARPVLVEGPLDAIAVTSAGAGRYAGVAPCGTALTAAQVAALDTCAGPLAERGVLVAFDNDRGGRQAALRAYELLRPTGAWPTSASLPDGLDPAGLAQQRLGTALLGQPGRVETVGQARRGGPSTGGTQQLIGPQRRLPAAAVVVERDKSSALGQRAGTGVQGGDLGGGERGAARGDAGVPPGAGGGDGDGVQRTLDQHRSGTGGQGLPGRLGPQAVEQLALPVQRGGRAVEVLRDVVGLGQRPAEEADDVLPAGVADREHQPVAEPVDDGAAAGAQADAGVQQLGVGVAAGAQVVGQRGPARRGVAELVVGHGRRGT